jgi:hypothetical protein
MITTLTAAAIAELNGTLAGPVLSPDGRWLYILNRTENRLLRIDAGTLRETHSTKVPDKSVFALSPDGRALYVGSPSRTRDSAGQLVVVDAENLTIQRTVRKTAEPFDLAAGANGRVFASGAGTGWSEIAVLDAAAGKVTANWGGVWAKSFIALTRDGSRLLTSTQGVTPGRLEAWPLPEPVTDKPDTYSAPAEANVGGPFVITSDCRFVLCSTGTILRLAANRADDLQPITDVGRFQVAEADPDHGAAFLLREDGTLDIFSYPEFKPQSAYRTGIAAYGMALDAKAGRLYISGIPLAALRDRPRAKAIGDLAAFDVRTLVRAK